MITNANVVVETNPNVVIEIAGYGDRSSAVNSIRQILTGYSQFAAWENHNENSELILKETINNIEILSNLLHYAETGKLPNEK